MSPLPGRHPPTYDDVPPGPNDGLDDRRRRTPAARGAGPGLSLEEARRLWQPVGVYLNTASYGLPPAVAWEALQQALEDWRGGRTSWEEWGQSTERSRAEFAHMVGVDSEHVAVGSTVSGLVAFVAASLPDGARVLAPDVEFTSNLFPFLAHAARGVEVDFVPADRLADSIDGRTDVVAFSAVQSATGEVADLGAIARSAEHHGALTVMDATQAAGWLPLDASRFDFVSCAAYKWLMSPRGTAFLTVRPDRLETLPALAAGWYAGEDPHSSYYGPPLRLARTARRLDVSPAWFSWVGTEPALHLINRIGVSAIHDHDVSLANRFRAGLGLPPGPSAIVCLDVGDVTKELARAGVMASVRAGRLRTAWHIYNTDADVDAALAAVVGSAG
ncbi:MAG: aminotransferase class V-fold PLP-dependent enzyme [Mycobacteriales bacterium]